MSILQMFLGAGAGGGGPVYVEDVFSTYLYEGNSSGGSSGAEQDIPNGIDIDGEGGMVWIKSRDEGSGSQYSHFLYDSERSDLKSINTNDTWTEGANSDSLKEWNSGGGFKIGQNTDINKDGDDFVSWTFRKAPGFFDVVTYEGEADTGTSPRAIAHDLGCKPGCIFFKNLDSGLGWVVYHKNLTDPSDVALVLDESWSEQNALYFGDTDPTSNHFYVGDHDGTNKNGDNIIAYLFADGDDAAAQIFGDDEDESIIKCGTYAGNGTKPRKIDTGFEPQFFLVKNASTAGDNWIMIDTMRGTGTENNACRQLNPNLPNAESGTQAGVYSSGVILNEDNSTFNFLGSTYIYIAIRRGPMKTPEDATKVFAMDYGSGSSTIPTFDSGFPVDMALTRNPTTTANNMVTSRLTGSQWLRSNGQDNESSDTDFVWDSNSGHGETWSSSYLSYMFRRAPGFFDVVCYEGTGTNIAGTQQVVNHGLTVTPELVIVKNRDYAKSHFVWSSYMTEQYYMALDGTGQQFNGGDGYWQANSTFTPTQFGLGYGVNTNRDGDKHIAYLFASLDGISKIGTYSGTGNNVDVICDGFSSGARFVLIKRLDAEVMDGYTGMSGWYIWDSTRGINASGTDDPYMRLDTDDAQITNTDYIDPHPQNKGFRVTSSASASLNASGGTYLYLAIA